MYSPKLPSLAAINLYVWLLGAAAELLIPVKLARVGLLRRFKVFTTFILADSFGTFLLWRVGEVTTATYRITWEATETTLLLLKLGCVLELYRLLYEEYPGIEKLARLLIVVGTVVALAATLGTISLDIGHLRFQRLSVRQLYLLERVVSTVVGVIVVVSMAYFPRMTSTRNFLLHGWLLSALFLSSALTFLTFNALTSLATADAVALAQAALQFACYLGWIVGLKPAGSEEQIELSEGEAAEINRKDDEFTVAAKQLVREVFRNMFKERRE